MMARPAAGAFPRGQALGSGSPAVRASTPLLSCAVRTHTQTVTLAGADTGRRSEGRERFLLCSRLFSSFFCALFISHDPLPVN